MTQDEIIEMARDADWGHASAKLYAPALERFAELVAAKEREACAKQCEGINSLEDYYGERIELVCAEAIRARGQA
jgi:hypothetical protein